MMNDTRLNFNILYFSALFYYIYAHNNDTIPIQYLDLIFIWILYSITFLMWQYCDLYIMQTYFNVNNIYYIDNKLTKILYIFNNKDTSLFLLNSWMILSPQTLFIRMKLNRLEFILFYLISGFVTRWISEQIQYTFYKYRYGMIGPSGIMLTFYGFLNNIDIKRLDICVILYMISFVILQKDYIFIITAICCYYFGYFIGIFYN